MSDENNHPPHGEEERTVFMPASGEPTPPPAPPVEERTAAAPSRPPEPEPAETTTPPPGAASGGSGYTQGSFQTQFAPRQVGQGIQVGDVLNHIFEVKRFIARGGMGEVFEGTNVNSEERVAIKVMLPSLAADPNVIGMFRKEARTLTRLNHEGLVNYRVLAQEPQLGVLYIVTEYIDGRNLADALEDLNPTPQQMKAMLRRLAAGLRAAHQLGAIHRDMSPDNVILEDGDIHKAKVIDFGIAKDLDPGSATIVGDGFAGKLNYVAPEQLGDFGREIGPWTDVYSLALVMLAVAQGKNVQMGGSLVDAVDKRRAGPDLSAAPEELKPVLAKMLKANPAERLRSMDEVLDELADRAAPLEAPPRSKVPMIAAGGVGLALVAIIGFLTLGHHNPPPAAGGGGGIVPASQDPADVARAAVDSSLPSIACTWLNVAKIEKQGSGVLVALTGVAGNPAAAQNEVSRALSSAKVGGANINFDEVAPITQSGCAALDTYRQIRVPDARHLSVPQRSFEMRMQPATAAYPGVMAANAIVTLNIGDPAKDFALVGIEPSGKITPLFADRKAFDAYRKGAPTLVSDLGSDRYRLEIDNDHTGWSGLMVVTGKPPFDPKVVAPDYGSRGPDWRDKFVSTAANQGWQADMVWYKSIEGAAGKK